MYTMFELLPTCGTIATGKYGASQWEVNGFSQGMVRASVISLGLVFNCIVLLIYDGTLCKLGRCRLTTAERF